MDLGEYHNGFGRVAGSGYMRGKMARQSWDFGASSRQKSTRAADPWAPATARDTRYNGGDYGCRVLGARAEAVGRRLDDAVVE
jgi:hypothetical protein